MTQKSKRLVIKTSGYNGHEPMHTCPHCHRRKPLKDFGFRTTGGNGGVAVQSWCKECRGKA